MSVCRPLLRVPSPRVRGSCAKRGQILRNRSSGPQLHLGPGSNLLAGERNRRFLLENRFPRPDIPETGNRQCFAENRCSRTRFLPLNGPRIVSKRFSCLSAPPICTPALTPALRSHGANRGTARPTRPVCPRLCLRPRYPEGHWHTNPRIPMLTLR